MCGQTGRTRDVEGPEVAGRVFKGTVTVKLVRLAAENIGPLPRRVNGNVARVVTEVGGPINRSPWLPLVPTGRV